jgi:hypothetical protein
VENNAFQSVVMEIFADIISVVDMMGQGSNAIRRGCFVFLAGSEGER